MIGVVLGLGFLLLLIALQAPLIAAVGVVTNLLAIGAAFGVARLIFQDGHGPGLLGFESQGFLDAWGPVFFFAMIFAISMDYTVFLLSSAKEHWDRSRDPKEAMVGGVAHSGRVIFAAAAVMVAVFFTFALSGPLPPKEMGVILGVAVLLDALLIRLVLIPVALRLLGRRPGHFPAGSIGSFPTFGLVTEGKAFAARSLRIALAAALTSKVGKVGETPVFPATPVREIKRFRTRSRPRGAPARRSPLATVLSLLERRRFAGGRRSEVRRDHALVGANLLRQTLCQLVPEIEDDDPVTRAHHEVHVVLDEEHA